VSEEESVRLYHAAENSTEYHLEDSKFIEVSAEEAGSIETLLHEYPKFTVIDDLPLDTDEEKVGSHFLFMRLFLFRIQNFGRERVLLNSFLMI